MYQRYITVEGTARERGRQIGEQLRMQILTNYKNQVAFYKNSENYDYTNWEEMAARYVPMMEKWTPEVLEEMYGMAEGAGIEFKKILALTTAYEKSFARDQISDKCTSFFASGKATKDGKTVIGQTNDEKYTEWLYQLDAVIHHKENGKEVMTYTHPGVPAYMGISNRGLAVLWTYIDNGITGNGVPTNAIIRHLLNCETIEEAVTFLQKVPHDIPNQFGLADSKGNLVCVECFPNKVYVTRKEDYFVHTNHNVYAPEEAECTCGKTTWDRYEVMEQQLKDNYGKIDVEMAKNFLKCHDRFPNSICVHPCPERPWNKTLAAMVYELDEGKMHIAFGNPCEMEYHTYTFDRYC